MMMKFGCCEGWMGHLRKAASTSRVAAWEPGGASKTISTTCQKDPQSHLKSSRLISELIDGRSGLLRGYEKS